MLEFGRVHADNQRRVVLERGLNFKQETAKGKTTTRHKAKPVSRPMEGVPFDVNPSKINRKLFGTKMPEKDYEEIRQLILKAFAEVDKNPERYRKPFKILIPIKTWRSATVNQLKYLSMKLGDHMADWVEIALVVAQQIQNGERWVDVMENNRYECFMMFAWGKEVRHIGDHGLRIFDIGLFRQDYLNYRLSHALYTIHHIVPVVVLY